MNCIRNLCAYAPSIMDDKPIAAGRQVGKSVCYAAAFRESTADFRLKHSQLPHLDFANNCECLGSR